MFLIRSINETPTFAEKKHFYPPTWFGKPEGGIALHFVSGPAAASAASAANVCDYISVVIQVTALKL